MSSIRWKVTFIITRQRSKSKCYQQPFLLEVDPDEYILDCIERIWAFHDRSLTFRHACHHSTCGACGMRVNGVEKLTCITAIRSVTQDGGTVHIEPLRNFPVLSDLVVDMSTFFLRLEQVNAATVLPLQEACLPGEIKDQPVIESGQYERLVDCIECGLCISACPTALTSSSYQGPATLAAIQQGCQPGNQPFQILLADHEDGVWRCHSAYECSAVCPSNVDPAARIMNLRRRILTQHIRSLFSRQPEEAKNE